MKLSIELLAMAVLLTGCGTGSETLSSPDGDLEISFALTSQGEPSYSAKYKKEPIVSSSLMGFEMKGGENLTRGFHIDSIAHSEINETWAPVWGENDSISNNCRQMTIYMSRGDIKMDIEFRAFNEGFGFRYIFPEQTTKQFTVIDEKTQMAMTGDHTAWWIPGDYDTQEYEYTKSCLSEIRSHADDDFMYNASQERFSPTGVQTALMLKTDNGLYLNLHEAALVDFPAMHLDLNDSTMVFKAHLTPGPDGTMATFDTPFKTPWRTVTVGEKPPTFLLQISRLTSTTLASSTTYRGFIPPNIWEYGGR